MPFSSLLFLSVFLPAFLAAYWVAPARAKNGVALFFSIAFYCWGAPAFLPVVLGLGVLDFFVGNVLHRARGPRRKALLVAGVLVHLSCLVYFKYSNFFVGELNQFLALFHVQALPWSEVVLPIGISFITFEEISYLVDVYRGDANPPRSIGHYLLFLMLFPHSIAGPIFRWKDLAQQLQTRVHSADAVVTGFRRFAIGLAKKVLIANPVAITADQVFGLPSGELGPAVAWIGIAAYALQIYFDFSGYSDMAIGLGRMAGFRFKENFNHPYISASITEFWRRWHISLSTWLRDYLYIALGGNRKGPKRTIANVFLVFLLSGLWHGPSWTFVIWGAYHGFWNILERWQPWAAVKNRLPRLANVGLTLVIVMAGWVFFRARNLSQAMHYLRAMLGHGSGPWLTRSEYLPNRALLTMAAGAIIALIPLVRAPVPEEKQRLAWLVVPACVILSIAYLADSKFLPLIYFKF